MGWTERDTDSYSEYSSDSYISSNSSQTRIRRKRRRPRKPPEPSHKPSESPRNCAADRPSKVKRRHNYEHARRRIRDKISELSEIGTAIYLFLR